MSSCLCKNSEGAVSILLVKLVEDRKDDAIHTVNIDKTQHMACPATNLNKTPLDHIGGGQLSPQRPGKLIKGQQIGQVLFQSMNQTGIRRLPAPPKLFESCASLPNPVGLVDGPSIRCDGLDIPLAGRLHQASQLMHPAPLMRH